MVNVGILEGPNDRYYEESEVTLVRVLDAKNTLIPPKEEK
jgi:hypothetical protein